VIPRQIHVIHTAPFLYLFVYSCVSDLGRSCSIIISSQAETLRAGIGPDERGALQGNLSAVKCTFISVVVVAAASVSAQDFGPIQTRNHRSLSLAFLRFSPDEQIPKPGSSFFDLSYTNANEFRRIGRATPFDVEEDAETSRFTARYRKGLKGRRAWGVEIPLVSRGGGFMDQIIDWYHQGVLHEHMERHGVPFARSTISGPGYTFGSGGGIGDITLCFSQDIASGLIASAGLKLPTGDSGHLLGSGNADGGLSLYKQWNAGRHLSLHAQLGAVFQGPARHLPGTRPLVDQEALALVYKKNSRDAWVVQLQGESSALKLGIHASDQHHQAFTVGYQRKARPGQLLELFFTEDRDFLYGFTGATVAPDFTMGIRLSVLGR
jgi:hypothetical protein